VCLKHPHLIREGQEVMPIYDYWCSQCHQKFEESKSMEKRHTAICPRCNTKGKLMPSAFSFKFFNPFTVDGEGFTSKNMRPEEVAELNQECRER